MNELAKPLLAVELFQGLKPLQITEIARRADRIVYKAGDVIMQRDETGDAAVLLVAGEAIRLAGPFDDEPRDQPLPCGSLLGEMAMLIETSHSATVIAKTSVRALRIRRSELQDQMMEDTALADHLVQRIASRLTGIAKALKDIDNKLAPTNAAFAKAMPASTSASLPAALH